MATRILNCLGGVGDEIESEFERAETKFIPDVGGRRPDERKRRIWVLLPHSEIFSRNRQPAESKHISARFGYPSDLCPGDLIDGQSFPFRLQPELDQAADGFGAIKFHALTRDPLVNCLQFIFGPLRIWASRKNPFCHPLCDPDGRGDFGQGGFLHVIFAFFAGSVQGYSAGHLEPSRWTPKSFPLRV